MLPVFVANDGLWHWNVAADKGPHKEAQGHLKDEGEGYAWDI